ncbi:polyphenol oxidase family protein [Candidatus Azambacteria bacterium]|nr:polyphenol oxidase family protein [Candidatus Azambacteria bacterium]
MSIIFPSFEKYPELVYGFSERQHGSMKWSKDSEIYQPCLENRKIFFLQKNISVNDIVTTELVHGSKVTQVFLSDKGQVVTKTDALMSNEKNIFLTVTGADCFPVYFYEPKKRIIGLAHVGWKGLITDIVPNIIEKINSISGKSYNSVIVGIGPGIRQCHFSVSLNDLSNYDKYPQAMIKNKTGAFINIPAIIKEQCQAVGVKTKNIDDVRLCTYCLKERFFSYRRDKPEFLETMIAYLGRSEKLKVKN